MTIILSQCMVQFWTSSIHQKTCFIKHVQTTNLQNSVHLIPKSKSYQEMPMYCYKLCFSEETLKLRREKAEELGYLEQQLLQLTNDIKDKIKAMTEDVERKVQTDIKGCNIGGFVVI